MLSVCVFRTLLLLLLLLCNQFSNALDNDSNDAITHDCTWPSQIEHIWGGIRRTHTHALTRWAHIHTHTHVHTVALRDPLVQSRSPYTFDVIDVYARGAWATKCSRPCTDVFYSSVLVSARAHTRAISPNTVAHSCKHTHTHKRGTRTKTIIHELIDNKPGCGERTQTPSNAIGRAR